MTYIIKQQSDKAKRFKFVPSNNVEVMPKTIGKDFPFLSLNIGQAFNMQFKECSLYRLALVKQKVALYNRKYKVKFHVVKHEDKLEIARYE